MVESICILVVDDNPAMAETLVDILLTDIKMPNMNGLELYRDTRKLYPRLITIFMTAYSADELIQQGMAEGVKIVLTKPVEINFLLSLLSAEQRVISEAHRMAAVQKE